MREKLKRCPFCGSEATLLDSQKSPRLYGVMCNNCYASVGNYNQTREDVVRAWNRRVVDK